MAHALVSNPKAPKVWLNFHQANVGGQLPAGSPLLGAARKSGAMGTRELPLGSQLHLEPLRAWALLSWSLWSPASTQHSFPLLGHVHREGPRLDLLMPARGDSLVSQARSVRAWLHQGQAQPEAPSGGAGHWPRRLRASPGFGVGPRLRSPGMRWTAPARCQSSDNHSASIIILPLSRSGSVPQADAKET